MKVISLLNIKHLLLFMSVVCVLIAFGLDNKTHVSLQISAFISLFCLIKEKTNKYKEINLTFLFLIIFALYVTLRPENFWLDYKIAGKILMSFLVGFALKTCLPNCYQYSLMALPITISTVFLVSFFKGFPDIDLLEDRLCLFYKFAPNQLGNVALGALIFYVALRDLLKPTIRHIMIIFGSICSVVVIMTLSRTAICTMIVCILFWFFSFKKKKAFSVILIITMISLVSIYKLPKNSFNRLYNSFEFNDSAFSGRFIIWEMSFDTIKRLNLWGNSNFPKIYTEYVKQNEEKLSEKYPNTFNIHMIHAHNVFLGIIIKYGIIGSILALIILLNFIYIAFKTKSILLKSILLGFVIIGITDDFLAFTNGIFFIFFPAGIATAEYAQIIRNGEVLECKVEN